MNQRYGATSGITGRALARGLLSLVVLLPCPSMAQSQLPSGEGNTRFTASVAMLAANSILGGLTASIRATLEGKPNFAKVFMTGAIGGGMSYAGKRLAVEPWTAAPTLGRVINAAGASIVLRAPGSSAGILDSIQVPVGPVGVRYSKAGGLEFSLDLYDTVLMISGLSSSELQLNWELTLQTLTPVFETRGYKIRSSAGFANGVTTGRVIVLDGTTASAAESFPHEVVHVLQFDFLQIAWGQPIERALRKRLLGSKQSLSWLQGGFAVPLLFEVDSRLGNRGGYLHELRESEATWLEKH